jgi:2-C-methyl-D-erythritol 4-phosphate cytidylyltransferase
MPRTAVVLVAAGSGTRVGATTNKVLLPLLGTPVLAWSLRTLATLAYVDRLVVVVRPEDADLVADLVRDELRPDQEATLVSGGVTRHGSEQRGLAPLRAAVAAGEVEVVAVHDAARPLADAALFDSTVRLAHQAGGALPVRAQHGLVDRGLTAHVRGLVAVQTPQAFRAGPLLEAYARAEEDGFTGTDTAGCVAAYTALEIHAVPAPATNLKITFPEDVALAQRLVATRGSVG